MIGTQLGPYEIIDEIGRGGMATVYRAYQPSMDRFVALKVIRPSAVEDEMLHERFQREARLIARLEHPHVLPVYDFDGSHSPPYIVMRYLEGGTLKEVLAERQLPFEDIAYLLRQVGSALDYAHRQGVIHRDVKPSNIMIDCDGNAFVMDFGIARFTVQAKREGDITGAGATLGTPDYMSPEQIMAAETIDQRADIYSLAVMLFQMTTGQLPYETDAPMVAMLKHLREPVPDASKINRQLPIEIDLVFKRAMAKDPADRYATIQDFVSDVLLILGGTGVGKPAQLRLAAQEISNSRPKRPEAERQTPPKLRSQETPTEQNKTITAVYTNAAEYAELLNLRLEQEMARQAVSGLWDRVSEQVVSYGGTIFNQSDYDLLALWGAESAREDDPEQAVRAALAIRDTVRQRSLGELVQDEPLPVKIGINTGLALLTMSEISQTYTASGASISLATRLADYADGVVLITHDTFRQVRGVFEIEPDIPVRVRRVGGQAYIETYRVTAEKPRAFRLHARGVEGLVTRMIGRRAEMERLQKTFINAIEDSETQLVTIVGEPGLGKSRLLYEFATWAELRPELFFIFRGRVTPAMTNRPYTLWRELLSFRFEIFDSDSPSIVRQKMELGVRELIGGDGKVTHLIGHLAGFDFADSPHLSGEPQVIAEQAKKAVTQFFSRLTTQDPVVLQLEDLHHADDASLDLLTEVVSADQNLPLLVVATARPELYERRPAWGSGQDFHIRLDLRPLDKRDSRELVAEILQKLDEMPRDLRDLIVDRAEGNPYYMEELVKMLIEDRVIQKLDEHHWRVESSRLERLRVPRTLVGLLQARFDGLLYPEKLTLQRAAVAGRVFHDTALLALDSVDEHHVDDLAEVLAQLVEREFIFPRETSTFADSREYIFAQAMMRDLIMETLLQRQLVTYSRAMADWLATQSGRRAGEYDALIAEYYDQAGEILEAAEFYHRASNSAAVRGALEESQRLLRKGLSLLDPIAHPSQHLELQLALGGLYGWMGMYDKAQDEIKAALKTARKLADRKSEANALAQLGRVAGIWLGDYQTGLIRLKEAMQIARELEDREILIFILRQLGNHASITGAHDEAKDYLQESLALALDAGALEDAANALNSLGENARHQGDYGNALQYYRKSLEVLGDQESPNIKALVKTNMGFVFLEQRDYITAKRLGVEALIISREIGTDYLIAGCMRTLGSAAIGLGDDEAGYRYLSEALSLFQEMGNLPELVTTVPDCARLRARLGDLSGALEWLGMALAHPSLPADGRLRTEYALGELRAGLPDDEVEAALARGAKLELGTMMATFMNQEGYPAS